jgi:hypothetical protein
MTALLVGLAFPVALIVFQSAVAIGQYQEPVPLKPPFVFHEADPAMGASSFTPLPPTASLLLTERFEAGFAPSFGTVGTTTKWYIFTDTTSVNLYWNRVLPLLSSGYVDTAWAACGTCDGTPGTSRDPDTDDYPPGLGTWMIYGPVNLSGYYDAELTFNYRLDADPAVDGSGSGDFFAFGVSDDGTHFTGELHSGSSSFTEWLTPTFKLTDYADKSSVYLGFYFHSNGDANTGKGALIDNVSLRAAPYLLSYLPQVAKNIATPTPTPAPYLYNYTFDSGLGLDDPDFKAWGGAYVSPPSGTPIYAQGLDVDRMNLWNTQLQLVSMASPNVSVSGNYEISADLNVFKGKNNARYGIVFGAGSDVFGRGSGNTPTFNSNGSYYVFALQFPGSPGNDPADYQLERCSGNGLDCPKLVDRTPIPAGANADGVWDKITVRRSGSSIVVLVNDFQILSVNDGAYTGTREFGVYIRSADVNGTNEPLEVFFDNYRVTQLP